MSNILASLGNQKSTEGESRAIIEALQLQKADLNKTFDTLSAIVENSEKNALERQRLQQEKNANIAQNYNEQSFMSRLQKMDSAKKDKWGSVLPSEQKRINAELENERAQFYADNGYSDKTYKGILSTALDKIKTIRENARAKAQENQEMPLENQALPTNRE
ncbi:hypothetical protein [Helicobacter himalayensis]|uniref:hypothetical protein n=1 Tax=Helicobacter himalayensis TaxID=1591088 RepID=UPI00082CF7C2|nr:hypothetical protein [Helicobacter himalayensis]